MINMNKKIRTVMVLVLVVTIGLLTSGAVAQAAPTATHVITKAKPKPHKVVLPKYDQPINLKDPTVPTITHPKVEWASMESWTDNVVNDDYVVYIEMTDGSVWLVLRAHIKQNAPDYIVKINGVKHHVFDEAGDYIAAHPTV
jgi:hypothetical protein